jgi:hypothetical protein
MARQVFRSRGCQIAYDGGRYDRRAGRASRENDCSAGFRAAYMAGYHGWKLRVYPCGQRQWGRP